MAKPSLSPSFAIGILARREAVKLIKRDLWARGAKLSYISPKEIRVIANEYLAAHPELLTQAAELIETSPAYRVCAELRTSEQKQSEPKSTTSTVHISGA
jgi:hypothetical protein